MKRVIFFGLVIAAIFAHALSKTYATVFVNSKAVAQMAQAEPVQPTPQNPYTFITPIQIPPPPPSQNRVMALPPVQTTSYQIPAKPVIKCDDLPVWRLPSQDYHGGTDLELHEMDRRYVASMTYKKEHCEY